MKFSRVKCQEISLKIFLFICILLPTGDVFGVNIKFISLFIVICLYFLTDDKNVVFKLFKYMIVPVIIVVSFLLIESYSLSFKPEALGQSKDILVLFLIIYMGIVFVSEEKRFDVIAKTIIKCLVFVGVLKILIIIYSMMSGVSVTNIIVNISKFFNTSLMTMESEDVVISRINFMSDYILPVALFITMLDILTSKVSVRSILYVIILLLSLTISLSRFIWGVGAICVIFALLSAMNRYKGIFISLSIIAMLSFLMTLPDVQQLIEFRVSSNGVVESDATRGQQLFAIINSFYAHPILGNGIGYFIPNLVRSDISRYSYELQIPALYMQMGIVGASILLLLITISMFSNISQLDFKQKLISGALFFIWLSGGFFNPVIISSTGAVAFLLLYCVPFYLKYKK